MPWYTTLPSDWQTQLEKKTGAHPYIEAIYDPDGAPLALSGEYDLVSIGNLSNVRDLDLEWGARAIIQDIALELNDPDRYFDPRNKDGILFDCYMELDRDHSAGATSIKLFPKTGAEFNVGSQVRINDGVNSELITVSNFTPAAGATFYHEIMAASGLAHDYAAGTRVYTTALEGRDVLLRLRMTGCASYVSMFRGRTIRLPEVVAGRAKLIVADFKKIVHDLPLIGADSDSVKKLKKIGPDGLLTSSIEWTGGWGDPPYAWSIESGAWPIGFDMNSETGALSGSPAETGTFTPVVKVENNAGDIVTQEISLRVVEILAEDFAGSYGPYSAGEDAALWSLAARSGWARCAFSSRYLNWKTAINDDSQNLRRTDMSGDWCLMVKVEINSAPAVGYQAGAAVKFSTGEGFIFGYYNATNRIVYRRVTETSGFTYDGTDAGYAGGREFLLKKVGSNYSVYHRAPGATSWGTEWGTKSDTNTVASVGVAIVTETTGSGTFDIDFARLVLGALSFVSSAISNGKVGVPYSCYVEAQGGTGEYSYSVTVGALPSGLSMSAGTGEISGDPVEAKDTTFTVQVTDSLGATATQEFTISISDGIVITPSVLRRAIKSTAYSAALNVNPTGELDREQVVVGANCRLGKWTITFSSRTEFTLEGPGVAGLAGSTATDFEIPGVLEIPAAAWGGYISAGDVLSFITAISWENEIPLKALYDITLKTGLPSNLVNASSYFGNKEIGRIYEAVSLGGTTLKIAVSVPTIVDAGDVLIIAEGGLSEEVTVSTGNTEATGYPPFIQVSVSAFSRGYTTAATVAWKQRAFLYLGGRYSYDDEYDYAEKAGLLFSLSADRDMSIAQAIEVISAHVDGFLFHDNWGVDRFHVLRPRDDSSLATLGSDVVKAPGAMVETAEIINEIVCQYGYDYANSKYLYGFTYPGSDAENKSLLRNQVKRSVELKLPGFYSEALAMDIARRKYLTREAGLHLFTFSTTLMALAVRAGDRFVLDSANANFNDVVEIVGLKSAQFINEVNLEFIAYDRAQHKDFAVVGDTPVGAMRAW